MARKLADYMRTITRRLRDHPSDVVSREDQVALLGMPEAVFEALQARRDYAQILSLEDCPLMNRGNCGLANEFVTLLRRGSLQRNGVVRWIGNGRAQEVGWYCSEGLWLLLDLSNSAEPWLVISWKWETPLAGYVAQQEISAEEAAKVYLLFVPDAHGEAEPPRSRWFKQVTDEEEGTAELVASRPRERSVPVVSSSPGKVAQVTPHQHAFLTRRYLWLKVPRPVSRTELATELGIEYSTTGPLLAGLVRVRILTLQGRGRGAKYQQGPQTLIQCVNRGKATTGVIDLSKMAGVSEAPRPSELVAPVPPVALAPDAPTPIGLVACEYKMALAVWGGLSETEGRTIDRIATSAQLGLSGPSSVNHPLMVLTRLGVLIEEPKVGRQAKHRRGWSWIQLVSGRGKKPQGPPLNLNELPASLSTAGGKQEVDPVPEASRFLALLRQHDQDLQRQAGLDAEVDVRKRQIAEQEQELASLRRAQEQAIAELAAVDQQRSATCAATAEQAEQIAALAGDREIIREVRLGRISAEGLSAQAMWLLKRMRSAQGTR